MAGAVDLDRYFERIGHHGTTEPTLATLAAIHRHHVAAIPFENLDPLMGHPVLLDPDTLAQKMVRGRRGGYCFEQNCLLLGALTALGFHVTGLGARVRWMTPPDRRLGPRGHMLLKVDLADGSYIADVGFGGQLLDAPLRLDPGAVQSTPWARYRFDVNDDVFTLMTEGEAGWHPIYIFNLERQLPADYEMANWYTSTNPRLWFTSALLMQRLDDDVRSHLFNTRLAQHYRDGRVVERLLTSGRELADVLETVFNVTPPDPADAIFARLSAGS